MSRRPEPRPRWRCGDCPRRFRWTLDYFRHRIDAHEVTPWQ